MTLFEKLQTLMASLVVSDRMPDSVAGGKSQKGLMVLEERQRPAARSRMPVWNRLELIRDPIDSQDNVTGAGSGKVTDYGDAQLVSDPFVPVTDVQSR